MIRRNPLMSLFLAFALCLALVGCSSNNAATPQTNQQAAEPAKQSANQPAEPENKTPTANVELYVLAAASLADAMKELTPQYESSHPGQKLVISYGSSGTLQKQIEQGAPADVFISAAAKQMDSLVEKKLIETHADLVTNKLVLITPKDSKANISGFVNLTDDAIKKIAIGQPESVPAGMYAKETLTNLGIWEKVQSSLVFAKDVRQVLSYVETGNVDAGIVYQTDAATSDKVTVAATAEESSHAPIVYPIGVIKDSKHLQEARELYDWLNKPEVIDVLVKYGFEPAAKH